MAKITVRGFVHAVKEPWDRDPKVAIYPFSMVREGNSYVLIGQQEFEVEVPNDFDMRGGLVANLEAEKKRIAGEFEARMTQLNAQIQSLLAIEA